MSDYEEIDDDTLFLGNETGDHNLTCGPTGYMFRMRSYRPWVFHTGSSNTIIIIIFNSMVVKAFRQKGLLSPATAPLITLAICDILASVFMFYPNELGFVFNMFHFDESRETEVFLQINRVKYPFCIFSEISYFLAHAFHSSSLFVTSLVAVQKAIVIHFPIWSKIYIMKIKRSFISCLVLILLSCILNISLVLYTVYPSQDEQWCCRENNFVKVWNSNGHKQILLVCYMVCFTLLVTSSVYIAFSLTCRRWKKHDNRVIRKRHHRSAMIVMMVAGFCLIIELIPFSCRSSARLKQLCSTGIHQFELLILQFGFAANFLIYIIMSKNLRSRIIFCLKRNEENDTQPRGEFPSMTSLNHKTTLSLAVGNGSNKSFL